MESKRKQKLTRKRTAIFRFWDIAYHEYTKGLVVQRRKLQVHTRAIVRIRNCMLRILSCIHVTLMESDKYHTNRKIIANIEIILR